MGNYISNSTNQQNGNAVKLIEETISNNCVVIFSKTSCPYCTMAKEAFDNINVNYKAIELDQLENGSHLQSALHEMTGARTENCAVVDMKNLFIEQLFLSGRETDGGGAQRVPFRVPSDFYAIQSRSPDMDKFQRLVPRVFVNGTCIGGGTETKKLNQEGKLLQLVQQCNLTSTQS